MTVRRSMAVQGRVDRIALTARHERAGTVRPTSHSTEGRSMAKVLGLGGLFFKSPEPEKLLARYAQRLGVGDGKASIGVPVRDDAGQQLHRLEPVSGELPTTSRRLRVRTCST